jgi:hypothetical protein
MHFYLRLCKPGNPGTIAGREATLDFDDHLLECHGARLLAERSPV